MTPSTRWPGAAAGRQPPEQVVERLRKLLALSTSSNPHEAALAAERAVEIAQRHNLDLARIASEPDSPYVERSVDVGAAAGWRWLLMSHVARASFCRALRRHERGRALAEMFVIGEPHNLAVCEFLYRYLAREIERLCDRAWERARLVYGEHVQARTWKHDFRRGAVATIGDRLSERARRFAEESAESEALVLAKDAALDAALERLHPGIATSRLRGRGGAAYQQGRWAAQEIALREAVQTRSPTGQRMLRG